MRLAGWGVVAEAGCGGTDGPGDGVVFQPTELVRAEEIAIRHSVVYCEQIVKTAPQAREKQRMSVGDVWTVQPRPRNGIFVAITVMNGTLADSGSPAM